MHFSSNIIGHIDLNNIDHLDDDPLSIFTAENLDTEIMQYWIKENVNWFKP